MTTHDLLVAAAICIACPFRPVPRNTVRVVVSGAHTTTRFTLHAANVASTRSKRETIIANDATSPRNERAAMCAGPSPMAPSISRS